MLTQTKMPGCKIEKYDDAIDPVLASRLFDVINKNTSEFGPMFVQRFIVSRKPAFDQKASS